MDLGMGFSFSMVLLGHVICANQRSIVKRAQLAKRSSTTEAMQNIVNVLNIGIKTGLSGEFSFVAIEVVRFLYIEVLWFCWS
jgi:hypothetical protein